MDISDWYNSQALAIWRKHGENEALLPAQLPITSSSDVIFVGMNPSFNRPWISNFLKKQPSNKFDIDTLFRWNDSELNERLEAIKEFELNARVSYNQYFRVFDQMVELCGYKNWTHLDIFLMRETNQNIALKSVGYQPANAGLNDFGMEQLDLFHEAIKKLKPKIVVIANATSSAIVASHYNESKMSTSFTLNNVKTFLTGMLSGQRALDRFSKLRLVNEINEHKNGVNVVR